MDTQEFYDEMDRLVEKGETTFPGYDLDLEALHYIKAIKNKVQSQRRLNVILGILFLLVIASVCYLFLNPGLLGNVNGHKSDSGNAELEKMVETLSSENQDLRLTVSDLQAKLEENRSQEVMEDGKVSNELANDENEQEIEDATELKSEVTTHIVAKGETLYSIAKQYYGTGSMFKRIMEDNNISDAGSLYEGMPLKIYPEN